MLYLTKLERNLRLKARMQYLDIGPMKLMKLYGGTKGLLASLRNSKEWRQETVEKLADVLHVDPLYLIDRERDENGNRINA